MADCPSNETVAATVQCPACRAVQPWADTCRRCKCDMSLLGSARRACDDLRTGCLRLLRQGRFHEAAREAQRLFQLNVDADSARLLAVCRLLCEDWPGALEAARRVGRE